MMHIVGKNGEGFHPNAEPLNPCGAVHKAVFFTVQELVRYLRGGTGVPLCNRVNGICPAKAGRQGCRVNEGYTGGHYLRAAIKMTSTLYSGVASRASPQARVGA